MSIELTPQDIMVIIEKLGLLPTREQKAVRNKLIALLPTVVVLNGDKRSIVLDRCGICGQFLPNLHLHTCPVKKLAGEQV